MLRCRCMLGCLGGASLHDPNGLLREQIDSYVERFPMASYEEVEARCFSGKDDSLKLFALSPRHFEAAMTKTCQVLVEGDYHNVFHPGTHYIEVKKDFSNIEDVLEKVKNSDYCSKIAENTYRDVVLSGRYHYNQFVKEVVDHVHKQSKNEDRKKTSMLIWKCAAFWLVFLEFVRPTTLLFRMKDFLRRIIIRPLA